MELYQKLIEELKKETGCYERLASFALAQKQFLISGEVEKVAENLKRQEKEVFALSPLLGDRNNLIAALGKSFRLPNATLTQILQKAPMEIAEELKSAVVELVRSARELEAINQGNEKLAHNALSLADVTLQALRGKGRAKSSSTYPKKNDQVESSFFNSVV
jgi:hypothetical protein